MEKEEQKPIDYRQIIIKFNSKDIIMEKAEVASNFELQAVLENILRTITK